MTVYINWTLSKIKPARRNVNIQKLSSSTRDVARLIDDLPTVHEAQGLTPQYHRNQGSRKKDRNCAVAQATSVTPELSCANDRLLQSTSLTNF